jgi:LPS-assembly lipoprotein
MWWPRGNQRIGRFLALALALGCAGLAGGCFQPLYGTANDAVGAPPTIRTALQSVDVAEVRAENGSPEARYGVEVRNAVIFGLTGGAGQLPPTHRLNITLSGSRQHVIVDITTARSDMEIYGVDAVFSLVDLTTKKTVLTGRAVGRASYDIPGQQQRFARQRGQRDAENRASGIIAEQIRSQIASYFVAGGPGS